MIHNIPQYYVRYGGVRSAVYIYIYMGTVPVSDYFSHSYHIIVHMIH